MWSFRFQFPINQSNESISFDEVLSVASHFESRCGYDQIWGTTEIDVLIQKNNIPFGNQTWLARKCPIYR